MVLNYRKRQGEGSDRNILVTEVDTRVALNVAEKVHRLVKVGDSVCLVTNEVVKTVCAVSVDEAITDPLSSADAISKSVTIHTRT